METRPTNRPVWPFILGAVLLLLLIVLVARSCRDEYGETPPPFGDTLTDTTMSPMNEEGYGPGDTAMGPMNGEDYDGSDTTLYDRNEMDRNEMDRNDRDRNGMDDAADTAVNNPTPTPPGTGTTSPPAATPAVTPSGAAVP